MFKVGDRVLYTQPRNIHSVFMPPNTTYIGTIIAVCKNENFVAYRIKLDINWGYIASGTENNSHVNPNGWNENVIIGNINKTQIVPLQEKNLVFLEKV